jgi:hypothetical protein
MVEDSIMKFEFHNPSERAHFLIQVVVQLKMFAQGTVTALMIDLDAPKVCYEVSFLFDQNLFLIFQLGQFLRNDRYFATEWFDQAQPNVHTANRRMASCCIH